MTLELLAGLGNEEQVGRRSSSLKMLWSSSCGLMPEAGHACKAKIYQKKDRQQLRTFGAAGAVVLDGRVGWGLDTFCCRRPVRSGSACCACTSQHHAHFTSPLYASKRAVNTKAPSKSTPACLAQ